MKLKQAPPGSKLGKSQLKLLIFYSSLCQLVWLQCTYSSTFISFVSKFIGNFFEFFSVIIHKIRQHFENRFFQFSIYSFFMFDTFNHFNTYIENKKGPYLAQLNSIYKKKLLYFLQLLKLKKRR